jgi:hypothetical protein
MMLQLHDLRQRLELGFIRVRYCRREVLPIRSSGRRRTRAVAEGLAAADPKTISPDPLNQDPC